MCLPCAALRSKRRHGPRGSLRRRRHQERDEGPVIGPFTKRESRLPLVSQIGMLYRRASEIGALRRIRQIEQRLHAALSRPHRRTEDLGGSARGTNMNLRSAFALGVLATGLAA